MSEQRMPTGVAGLDEILNGGLIPCRTYLIVGATGTGKTILSLQWLLEGLQQGERGLYITLAESASDIRQNAQSLGWNLDDIEIIDLAPGSPHRGWRPSERDGRGHHLHSR